MVTPRTGRPRGRPPGSKNLPKTLEAFVALALAEPAIAPPRPVKVRRKQDPAKLEERRARMLHALKSSDPAKRGRKKGTPFERTSQQQQAVLAEQTALIDRIMKKMAKDGITPDDPMAVESLKAAMVVLRTQADAKTKLAAARLVLDFTKAKPTTKIEHTVRTAEDILDEMAEDEE